MSERPNRWLAPSLLVALAAGCLARAGDELAVDPLLRAADAARLTLTEGKIHLRATVFDPRKDETVASHLDVYVKGEDRVLCVFLDGQAGGKKILASGDRVWLLVPGTTHPIPISASQRLLGGASVADVARLRFAEDFRGTLRPERETVDGVRCRVVDLTRRSRRAPYASGTLWVGESDNLPRRVRLNLGSGKQAKEIHFSAYGKDQGRTVLRRMEIHHRLTAERGTVTTLEFLEYLPEMLPADAFDPAGARAFP